MQICDVHTRHRAEEKQINPKGANLRGRKAISLDHYLQTPLSARGRRHTTFIETANDGDGTKMGKEPQNKIK